MTIHLDHCIVPTRTQIASAKLLADYPAYHLCFLLSQAEFDAILERIKARGIAYRSAVRGPVDMQMRPGIVGIPGLQVLFDRRHELNPCF